jgi:hypothetical protein
MHYHCAELQDMQLSSWCDSGSMQFNFMSVLTLIQCPSYSAGCKDQQVEVQVTGDDINYQQSYSLISQNAACAVGSAVLIYTTVSKL